MAFADVLKTASAQLTAANAADLAALKAANAAQVAALKADITALQKLIPDPLAAYAWEKHRGDPLNLAGFTETFRDDFNANSITGSLGPGPWYAPARSNFGGAPFKEPGSVPDPFLVQNGEARLRLEKVGTAWQTGHMQTMNAKGVGFAQSMGYFEFRTKFPTGPVGGRGPKGAWPGLWLKGANDFDPKAPDHRVEIDILEAYGGDQGIHSTVHVIPRGVPKITDYQKRTHKSHWTDPATANHYSTGALLFGPAQNNIWDSQFHTYGVMLDEQFVTMYYEGLSVGRFPMLPYFKTPLYMLITMTMFERDMAVAVGPMDLTIDYVRAMKKA